MNTINLKAPFASCLSLVGVLVATTAGAQSVTTFTTPGSSSWTAPAGVYLVQVEAWGGGGGGGGAKTDPTTSGGSTGVGGGAGGGAYAKLNSYNVTPATGYAYTVGVGGAGVSGAIGTAGGDTTFFNATTLKAVGGAPGGGGTNNAIRGAAGAGGDAALCVGDVKYSGGSGGTSTSGTSFGGQGGGSGGTGSNGNNGAGNTGGEAAAVTGGGPGGAPNPTSGSSGNGQTPSSGPGGGGGGCRRGAGSSINFGTGGAGRAGQLRLTYYAQPTSQASSVTFSSIASTTMTVSWTRGNGSSCIVVVKDGSSVNANPAHGTSYTADAAFGSGSQIGTGNYVVYQGTGTSVNLTGLTAGNTYYVAVYELNGGGTALVTYQTTAPASGSQTVGSTAPELNSPTKSAIASTTATLGATVANDNGNAVTEYGVVWATSANPTTADNKVQAGTSITPPSAFTVGVTGLPAGTLVHYRGYAISGTGTGYSGNDSFTTLAAEPTAQASAVTMASTAGGSANLSWTRGNGTSCLVLMKAGSAVDANPSDAASYIPNANFGSGSQLGSGNFVIYSGTGSSTIVTALTPGATYHLAVYEFNGTGGTENYLTLSAATASGATATTNVVYYSNGGTSGTPNAATSLANWWTGTAGTGANPANFTGGDKFVFQNGSYYNINGTTWTVSGGATVQLNSGSTLQVEAGTSSTLQLSGNLINNGTLKANGTSSTALIRFSSIGGTSWTWTGNGDFSATTKMALAVDAGVTLDASGIDFPGIKFPTANNTSVVNINGTLNIGTRTIDGGTSGGNTKNTFAVNAGGTLITANTGGVGPGTGTPATGTIFNYSAGKVTFNAGASFVFNGTANQDAGSAFPTTIANLTINNPGNTVTLPATSISGLLHIQSGLLSVGTTTNSTAGALSFDGSTYQANGTWGSTSSLASNTDDTRFADTGYITMLGPVSVIGSSQFRSRASGDWNSATTWEISNDSGTTWSKFISGFVSGSTPSGSHVVSVLSGHNVALAHAESCSVLTVNSGGTLNCNSNSLSSASFTLSGSLAMRLNKANPGMLTSGKLMQTSGTFSAGGALTVTASGEALTGGEVFDLFDAPTFNTGSSFTTTTLPALPSGLNWWAGNLLTDGTLRVNVAPTAGADNAGTTQGQTITLASAKLLANDTGEAGETLSITAVTSPTSGSGTATLGVGGITYTAPLSGSGDTITYTLSDGRGGSATGMINVTLTADNSQGFNQLGLESLGGGAVRLTYLGMPGTNYALDWRTNLVLGDWVGVATNPAGPTGSLVFTNTSSEQANFYRTRYVP